MAEKLDDVTVKMGRLIRVKNLRKHPVAKDEYVSVFVEDFDGKNERCLLFTKKEIDMAERRANRNQEDLTELGFLTDLFS